MLGGMHARSVPLDHLHRSHPDRPRPYPSLDAPTQALPGFESFYPGVDDDLGNRLGWKLVLQRDQSGPGFASAGRDRDRPVRHGQNVAEYGLGGLKRRVQASLASGAVREPHSLGRGDLHRRPRHGNLQRIIDHHLDAPPSDVKLIDLDGDLRTQACQVSLVLLPVEPERNGRDQKRYRAKGSRDQVCISIHYSNSIGLVRTPMVAAQAGPHTPAIPRLRLPVSVSA